MAHIAAKPPEADKSVDSLCKGRDKSKSNLVHGRIRGALTYAQNSLAWLKVAEPTKTRAKVLLNPDKLLIHIDLSWMINF
ncbi:hypothetical protein PSQ20_13180 [Curvibacter sp. RS43]|uniref:hypothetical protein n=1 Tax=Curvibacter microcysteis TaxID=3026419 RepID=UPI0023611C91|nr:hypothetical protein [Curvibacter sp. RS43]MDD0811301.1 hypothetical protein [Curvibacter sp. RS43]